MLGLPVRWHRGPVRAHLRDLLMHDPVGEAIVTAAHCYGCTAGQGSSCGGALGAPPAVTALGAPAEDAALAGAAG
jgi:hypothetical protein